MTSDTSISLDTQPPARTTLAWDTVRLLRELILPFSSAVAWRLGTSRAIITILHPGAQKIPVADLARSSKLQLVDIQSMEPDGPGIEIAALVQPESALEITLLLNPRSDNGATSSFSVAIRLDAPTAASTLLDRIEPLLQEPRFAEVLAEETPRLQTAFTQGQLIFERYRTVTEGTTLKLYFRQPEQRLDSATIN